MPVRRAIFELQSYSSWPSTWATTFGVWCERLCSPKNQCQCECNILQTSVERVHAVILVISPRRFNRWSPLFRFIILGLNLVFCRKRAAFFFQGSKLRTVSRSNESNTNTNKWNRENPINGKGSYWMRLFPHFSSQATILPRRWTFIAVSYTTTSASLYFNGMLVRFQKY